MIDQDTRLILSIRQPWAWLIVNGHKDVENRTWPTLIKARIWVHAGKAMNRAEYADAVMFASNIIPDVVIPPQDQLEFGGIVGSTRISRCYAKGVFDSDSPWFTGPYGFKLSESATCQFRPMTGKLGFFTA